MIKFLSKPYCSPLFKFYIKFLIIYIIIIIIKARTQHLNYINALKDTGLKLFELEPNEKYPDGVFVEDTAVVIGKKILITNPGADSRRGEAEATAEMFLKIKNEFCQDLEIFIMDRLGEATVDGGDCCFTGRELLVGLSKRTNRKGCKISY